MDLSSQHMELLNSCAIAMNLDQGTTVDLSPLADAINSNPRAVIDYLNERIEILSGYVYAIRAVDEALVQSAPAGVLQIVRCRHDHPETVVIATPTLDMALYCISPSDGLDRGDWADPVEAEITRQERLTEGRQNQQRNRGQAMISPFIKALRDELQRRIKASDDIIRCRDAADHLDMLADRHSLTEEHLGIITAACNALGIGLDEVAHAATDPKHYA